VRDQFEQREEDARLKREKEAAKREQAEQIRKAEMAKRMEAQQEQIERLEEKARQEAARLEKQSKVQVAVTEAEGLPPLPAGSFPVTPIIEITPHGEFLLPATIKMHYAK
jgi:hypothetical protein